VRFALTALFTRSAHSSVCASCQQLVINTASFVPSRPGPSCADAPSSAHSPVCALCQHLVINTSSAHLPGCALCFNGSFGVISTLTPVCTSLELHGRAVIGTLTWVCAPCQELLTRSAHTGECSDDAERAVQVCRGRCVRATRSVSMIHRHRHTHLGVRFALTVISASSAHAPTCVCASHQQLLSRDQHTRLCALCVSNSSSIQPCARRFVCSFHAVGKSSQTGFA